MAPWTELRKEELICYYRHLLFQGLGGLGHAKMKKSDCVQHLQGSQVSHSVPRVCRGAQ